MLRKVSALNIIMGFANVTLAAALLVMCMPESAAKKRAEPRAPTSAFKQPRTSETSIADKAAISNVKQALKTHPKQPQTEKQLQAAISKNYGPLLARIVLNQDQRTQLLAKLSEREAILNDLRSYFVAQGDLYPDPEFFNKAKTTVLSEIDEEIAGALPANSRTLYKGFVLHPPLFRLCDEAMVKLSYSETPITDIQRTQLENTLLEVNTREELLEHAKPFLNANQWTALFDRVEMSKNFVAMREKRLRLYDQSAKK